MNWKYTLGAFFTLPLLPLMYLEGKRIRTRIPQLPEAQGPQGSHIIDGNQKRSLRLITIGESTIAGVGVQSHEEGFTGTLAKELANMLQMNISWKVYAKSGYKAIDVNKKIVPKIKEEHIDLVVIGLGGNDAFQLTHPATWRKEIKRLIETLRSSYPEAYIVFGNMPPIKEFPAFTSLIKLTIGNLGEILGEEVEKLVTAYDRVFYYGERITLEGWIEKLNIQAKRSDFFSDGVHPSRLTYQAWAKDIAIQISENKEMSTTFIQLDK